MSDESSDLIRNLDRLLFENTGETAADVRSRLEAEGVDVDGLVSRVKRAAGEAYRRTLTEAAEHERVRMAQAVGSVFGDLAKLARQELVELVRAAAAGRYGADVMARCRNQQAENLSEDDLRTLLQDIEGTMRN